MVRLVDCIRMTTHHGVSRRGAMRGAAQQCDGDGGMAVGADASAVDDGQAMHVARRRGQVKRGFTLVTANVTGRGAYEAFVHECSADVIMVQEHKVSEAVLPTVHARLRGDAISSFLEPSKGTAAGGLSAGVGFAWPSHICIADMFAVPVPHRVARMVIQSAALGTIVLYSAYAVVG